MPRLTRVREVVFFAIGVVTPLAVLAVNGAAFIMRHLAEFRVSIAIAALVSSLLLNGLAAYSAIRFAQRNAPLLYSEYRRLSWFAAVVIVLGTSLAAGYLTYLGMQDPAQLPDRTSILASVFALATPFLITYADRRFLRRREVAAERDEEADAERRPQARPRPGGPPRPGGGPPRPGSPARNRR